MFVFQLILVEPTDSEFGVFFNTYSVKREPFLLKFPRQPFGEKPAVIYFFSLFFYFSRTA